MPSPAAPPTILVADIGGTTCRFAMVGPDGRPERVIRFPGREVADMGAAITRYMTEAAVRPQVGVLALAAPVDSDEVVLTNRDWRFRLSALRAQLGFAELHAINDFAAVAWALPGLRADDVKPIGPVADSRHGVKVACGPGTGLGVAALVPENGSWRVISSEGGHISFGPADDKDDAIFVRLRATTPHLTAEMVLSGPGFTRLHGALHPDAAPLASEEILRRATAGDAAAGLTVATFVRLLGRFAGDVALMFKATEVYLAGGVGEGVAPLIDAAEFRYAFQAHPPYQSLLATVPTFVITERTPGLIGCAVYAQQRIARGEW
jgi:glucokinase